MITDKLRELVTSIIIDNANGYFDSAKVGLGGNSTNPTATDLDVPLTSVTPTIVKTKSDLNVIEVKVSVDGQNIQGKVIREVGLFNGSDMVYRANFDGVGPFSTTETLELFILLEVE